MEHTLRLDGVRKTYGVGTPVETEVLHGIDTVLERGEFAALIGPSGSGKSTLLNLIGLLDRPTGGRVYIEGQEAGTLEDADLTRLRGIARCFRAHSMSSRNQLLPIRQPSWVNVLVTSDERQLAVC